VGVGDPLEAAFTLAGPIPAGTWTLVGDGVIIEPVDVQWEVIWRPAEGADTVLATWNHHFEPQKTGFDAVPYEETRDAPAADAAPGDRLVLRYQAMNATQDMAYIPNGDGVETSGRIPNLLLPR
jgi:hypothetical protein